MPTGPKGENRPADIIGNAVKIARIATGEIDESDTTDEAKDEAARKLGKRGGEARAKALSPEQRSQIARRAAEKRWKDRS